jgi:uncharacterized protein YkwD
VAGWRRFTGIGVVAALALVGATAGGGARQAAQTLSLDEARQYMVELINRDRATKDLVPVTLDGPATLAAQRHAEEMASERYMSHYNLAGKSPNQRYTEAGGTGYSRENIYLATTRYAGESGSEGASAAPLAQSPRFTRQELEEIESSYFNEVPPNDGHRKNILSPEHTHVGIGLARSAAPGGRALGNAQEFVDRYVEVEPIPSAMGVDGEIRVAGRVLGGVKFRSISVARGPLPEPLTKEKATAIHSYSVPHPDITYWPPPYRSARQVRVSADGAFSVTIPVGSHGAGVYYIGVWVDDSSRDILGSLRTVVVR